MESHGNQKLIKKLTSLAQLDIDAFHAYGEAIKNIDVIDIKDTLTRFQLDHQRHVENVSELISSMGGDAPEFKRDLKGYVIEGFTALRSGMGTEQALKAMKMNEMMTNNKYGQAITW